MPKMKSHKGSVKRFKKTGTGKLLRRKGYGSHLKSKKSSRQIRGYRKLAEVAKSDEGKVKRLLMR